jgi:lysophospholipase L1-like esterase
LDASSSASGDDASGVGTSGTASSEAGDEGQGTSDDGATATDDGPGNATPEASACVTGQVPPNKVIVLGDSYLDHPVWSNAIPDLYADLRSTGALGATATYREYQLGGAAMNYGTLNLNIPYQYETSAKGDLAVMNPTDIDTIIMDGGGNDVLIDNQECLTNAQPPPANADCATAIQGTVNRASKLLQEAAADGVKHVVYIFYPHLDPAGGGILPMPAPQVNATLDYAYPLAEQICCGSAFTSTATSYTCSGSTSGTQCIFIDIRPAFEGHVADYIKSDHVHPTDAGAQVIADLVAGAMRSYCIAQ